MAPPDRHPGFSKRAQYFIFTSHVAAWLGALLGFALLVVSFVNPTAFAFARSSAADAAAPVGEASASGRRVSQSFLNVVTAYIEAGSKNARLREQLAIAKSKLIQARATEAENRRLRALLRLRDQRGQPVAAARLIGSTSTSSRRFALMSAGAAAGVMVGQPVRSPVGLVGRVLEVGTRTARILLITDSESIVPVRRARDNVVGFAQGQADGTLLIRLIDMGRNPLAKGDVMVTSGSGGLYHPGVPVAVIENLTRDGGVARILSDPAATDFVLVEESARPRSDLPPPQAEPDV